jgi:hypothetical protein
VILVEIKGGFQNIYFYFSLIPVNNMPSWLPGTAFKAEAQRKRKNLMDFVERPFKFAKEQTVGHEPES